MKQQVICIHGGEAFETYKDYVESLRNYKIDINKNKKDEWKSNLQETLGSKYEVILPTMPCKQNAKYKEWEIMFQHYLEFLRDDVILIGHSLGGIFLAKYLTLHKFPHRIKSLHLVAAPFEDKQETHKLADFVLPNSPDNIIKQVKKIYIYHSRDDSIVPFADAGRYMDFLSDSRLYTFEDKGHFNKQFLEINKIIKDEK